MKTSSQNQLNHVSKKFYRSIIDRVTDVFSTIEIPSSPTVTISAAELAAETIEMIDRYISDGTVMKSSGEMALLAFLMVKPEIDKAADRSRRARQSAARRAQLKQTSIAIATSTAATAETIPDSTETQSPSSTKPVSPKPVSPKPSKNQKPMKKFGVHIVHRHPAHKSRYKKF